MSKLSVFLLFVATSTILVQASTEDSQCAYVTAPDGGLYDLTFLSFYPQQYTQYAFGTQYTYNISICTSNPTPCSGACPAAYSSGVCMYWGPTVASRKCLGSYDNRKVVGLNNGAGVQITYSGGDICGSCSPNGPRTSVINLKCDNTVPSRYKIYWQNSAGGDPGTPPVIQFNGSIYCAYTAPYKPPTPVSNSCTNIQANDGSNYNLYDLMGREFAATWYDYNLERYRNVTFSICGTIGWCGTGACKDYSGSVCQRDINNANYKCWGKYDSTATVEGLYYGQGVKITYDHGDDYRKTVLRLNCRSWYFSSELYIDGINSDPYSSILYINASIGCDYYYAPTPSYVPSYTPYYAPRPSYTPSSPPSGYSPYKYVSIQYTGYGQGCNGTDAYEIVVNRTNYCYPGCQLKGNKYVLVHCDDDVYLPRGFTWVEQINYGTYTYSCDVPQAAIYRRSRQCGGAFNFSYQECDADMVYTYSCSNAYCNQCSLSAKTPTDYCSYGTQYQCVSDYQGQAYPNPLM